MDIAGPKFLGISKVAKPMGGERLVAGDLLAGQRDEGAFTADEMIMGSVANRGADALNHLTIGAEASLDDKASSLASSSPSSPTQWSSTTACAPKGFKMKPERGLLFPRAIVSSICRPRMT